MRNLLRPTLSLLTLLALLTGIMYPVVVIGLAAAFFPAQAQGSLVRRNGRVLGSALIGQYFDDPSYFWSRPSATGRLAYNAAASSGSNLGPSNPALKGAVRVRIEALRAADPEARGAIPVDLVTASASGLDPHISPQAAYYQVHRVARARGLPEQILRAIVAQHIEGRTLGIVGEPVVNVLRLNLALDERQGIANE